VVVRGLSSVRPVVVTVLTPDHGREKTVAMAFRAAGVSSGDDFAFADGAA
jgi:hypothetical protein